MKERNIPSFSDNTDELHAPAKTQNAEKNLKLRVLKIIAVSGTVANTIGFLANFLLYGMDIPTAVCGICACLIAMNLVFGLRSPNARLYGGIMLSLLNLVEFPMLTLAYGSVMYPYMLLGFLGLLMLSEGKERIVRGCVLAVCDVAVIVFSTLRPFIFGDKDAAGLLGSAILTFLITLLSMSVMVIMWQSVYLTETVEIDSITGALSRVGFLRRTSKQLKNDKNTAYTILYFNIIGFKAINSVYGIDGGNRLLTQLGQRLLDASFKPKYVGRLNADHFVCLVKQDGLEDYDLEDVCHFRFLDKGRSVELLLNCGIYRVADRSLPVESMCDRAQSVLRYVQGRQYSHCAEYDNKAENAFREETIVLGEIEQALQQGAFIPYYQPIVDCRTGKIVSAEALARWIHPTAGVISPGRFIPVLEKKELVSQMDSVIFKKVSQMLEARSQERLPVVPVSINLSRMDLYDPMVMRHLLSTVEKSMNRNLYRIEVTESAYETMSDSVMETLNAFRDFGAQILVDDFGSGFSSLGMITDYQFDIIKLDMQFASKLETNEKVCGVVKSMISMAHMLGAKVIAEGIENAAQLQIMQDSGCDYIQGFYFYKPMPEAEFLALMNKQ